MKIIISEYEKVISRNNDFIENIRIVSAMKEDMSLQNPLAFKFMVKAYYSLKEVFPEGLPSDLANVTIMSLEQISKMSNNDPMLFKEGIDSEKAHNIIIWAINGFSESLLRYGDNVDSYREHHDELVKEREEYLQLLHKILYR